MKNEVAFGYEACLRHIGNGECASLHGSRKASASYHEEMLHSSLEKIDVVPHLMMLSYGVNDIASLFFCKHHVTAPTRVIPQHMSPDRRPNSKIILYNMTVRLILAVIFIISQNINSRKISVFRLACTKTRNFHGSLGCDIILIAQLWDILWFIISI